MGPRHPPLGPFTAGNVWALTADEAAAFDQRAIDVIGVPQPVLMDNAGRAAAGVVQRLYPRGPVAGVVGAGNNGGDALVALRTLAAWGRDVLAVVVADRPADDPLLHGWPIEVAGEGGPDDGGIQAALTSSAVVLDGVLGTGARGAPRERQAKAIQAMNLSDRPVVAIDVPSGIDASTGAVPGVAVRSQVTVSFGAPKVGALLHPARALVGRHVVVEIGFPPPESAPAFLASPEWARARLPRRGSDTHKNAVGRVLVVAGQRGMGGAAILAARAAFGAGAGLVRVCSVEENRAAVHAAVPEAMFVDASDASAVEAALEASDAVAAGPGIGTAAASAERLARLLDAAVLPTVLDADALNIMAAADGPSLSDAAAARPLLITPHPGELSRLMPDAPEGRLRVGRAAAERFGCAVLYKGAPSILAQPDGLVAIDTQGSSDLAVAGMGDVLTGVCVALLAQGLSPADAGSVGLYLSGRSGRIAGRGAALTPSDVVRWLSDALTETGSPESGLDLPGVVFDDDAAR